MVPVFERRTSAPVDEPAPAGSPGIYQLTYVLAVPGRDVVQDEIDFAKLVQTGDSLLEAAPSVQQLQIDLHNDNATSQQRAIVNVNRTHRLRDIQLEVQADNFAQAAQIGHDLVAPLLSRWAFLHDVAIMTSAVQIVETTTQIHDWSLTMIGAVKGFSDTAGIIDPDHHPLLSAYRDGISSTEPLWQALSLYKVAEGVRRMRQTRTSAAVAAGNVPNEPSERVPSDLTLIGHPNERAALQESLAAHAGKKFTAVLDEIRPGLRHAIAHLDPDGNPLVQDRWDDLQKVEKALPGLRWLARLLLDAELQAD